MTLIRIAVSAALAAAVAVPAVAGTVTLDAAKDNTLFESEEGFLSNGAGDRLFCGRSNQGATVDIKRPVLAFDIAAAVPAGSTITAVTLTLTVDQSFTGPQTCSLHRLQRDWGEAGSDSAGGGGGGGTFPEVGDATWIHTFFDFLAPPTWDTPGGDFDAAASAAVSVGSTGTSPSWTSATMVSEVQGWLDDPAANFGWLVRGNESVEFTAKAFRSREFDDKGDTTGRPELEISFDPPAPCDGNTNGDDDVDVNDLNNVILDWGTDGSANGGDVTGVIPGSPPDGIVDMNDLNAVIVNWGVCP